MSSPKVPFTVVAAWTRRLGIGRNNTLPWPYLKSDMTRFFLNTRSPPAFGLKNVVIMGRRTWESIPAAKRPLSDRINVVLTNQDSKRAEIESNPDCYCASSFETALSKLSAPPLAGAVGTVFVIGGSSVFAEAMAHPWCEKVMGTEVLTHFECDTFMVHPSSLGFELVAPPGLPPPGVAPATPSPYGSETVVTESGVTYQFLDFVRKEAGSICGDIRTATEETKVATADGGAPASAVDAVDSGTALLSQPSHSFVSAALRLPQVRLGLLPPDLALQQAQANAEEAQYLHLVAAVVAAGETRGDRTGTGTRSRFGAHMRFSLRDGRLPLLTTKRVFWRGVCEELLWFIKGSTNAQELADKGVGIWNGNGSREFLDKIGQGHRQAMDLGPVYGFQWRHFGAKYTDMHADYTNKGVDQLAEVVKLIKTDPTSRRIIMSAWNPTDLPQMALPPCHVMSQFYVSASGELSCQLYQRSADLGLGVPFNIASYALLTHLLAHVCGLRPGELVHVIGDAHVYLNHVEPLKEQVRRVPREFPTLRIKSKGGVPIAADEAKGCDIDGFVFDDFEVVGYNPDKAVAMKMAV